MEKRGRSTGKEDPSQQAAVLSADEWVATRDRRAAEAVAERARAETLWQRLQASGGPQGWKSDVVGDPEYHRWAFCERLCNESAELADDDPDTALELAELALDLVPLISGDKHLLSGIQEYIWKHLGNVFRARGDLKKAQGAFERGAEFFLTGITGSLPSLILRGRLAVLDSALHRDRGDLGEALRQLDHATSISDRDDTAAIYLEKARLQRQLGHPDKALEALNLADRRAEGGAPPRTLVRLALERGEILCDLGRHDEVKKLAAGHRKVAESFPFERARLLCLEGRLAVGRGDAKGAQAALRKALDAPPKRAVAGVALLLLESAALAAQQGQTEELKTLAEHIRQFAENPGLGRESAATLKLFCRLAAQDKLTAERAQLFVRDWARLPARG